LNQRGKEEIRDVRLIPVYFYGKQYYVPESFTIIQAYEYSGHQYTRGCGCRGGACGACAAIFVIPGSPHLKTGLACQTQVVQGMSIIHIPYFPTEKPGYEIEKLPSDAASIGKVYPKLYKCLQCNTCTKMCPQDINVMDCMALSMRGDIMKVAIQSVPCVMCGLCAARCPAEIAPYNIMLLSRRLYGRYLLPPSKNVLTRIKQIEDGEFSAKIDELMAIDIDQLKEMYEKQQADKRVI
jgi:ferredoxin